MKYQVIRSTLLATVAACMSLFAANANAQVMSNNASGVKGFFAAQSEAFRKSDPNVPLWPLAGIGPYPSGAGITNLPAAPLASISAPPGNAFSGTGYTPSAPNPAPAGFDDTVSTTAVGTIADSYPTNPVLTSDARITIPSWTVNQNASAVGYAYEQMNFGSNYLVLSNPGLGANPSPSFPIFVSGQVISPGTYAQFDGVINYTWLPVTATINTAGTYTLAPNGPSVSLGSLNYAYLQPSGGTFAAIVPSSGSLLATPAGDGILALDGEMWIAGDPFTLHATSTAPEPAALSLMSLAGVLLFGRRKPRIA